MSKKALAPTEKEIEKSILQYLEFLPECVAWKNQSSGLFDPTKKVFRKAKSKYLINGVSDILGIYQGKFLAVEVKRPTNKKRTVEQNNFINMININGGIAFYASSIDEVKEKLKSEMLPKRTATKKEMASLKAKK
jgi:penicillin-binding protein-related factor A (putative recombinase)